MSPRTLAFLCALLPLPALADDASLGGMLKGLHCTTETAATFYAFDGGARTITATKRGDYTLAMDQRTVNRTPFKVTAVTDRVSYKEVRFIADATEYRVSIVGAAEDNPEISLDVIRTPQARGLSRQSGACERS